MEIAGDSSRDGSWALVRLQVEGDRIVAADAPGLDRPLVGLTLLEAAAVSGETLAVDALANALGQVFHAPPDPARVAVAMSGGVDSAVTLLKAGPNAIGVTLRLWLDPHGPDSERACCSPEAVLQARSACHARGVPHVTLDLREQFHASVVDGFVRGYAAGETPNPCVHCNGSFRFDELLAFADRAGAARLATGHYVRVRNGLLARAADPAKDQSYMLATLDPALLDRLWFPLGEQTKADTRAEATAAGLATAPSSTRTGRSSAATAASGASRPDSAAGSASPRRSRCTRSAPTRPRTPSSRARALRSRRAASRCEESCTRTSRTRTPSSDTVRPRSRRRSRPCPVASASTLLSPPSPSRGGRRPFST
jgi:hypothetical protein